MAPLVKVARTLDAFEEPTRPDPFARLVPRSVEIVCEEARDAVREAGSRYDRADALLDDIDRMLRDG